MKKLVVLLAVVLLAALALAPGALAQAATPEQVVNNFNTAFNGGNVANALALFADNAVIRTPSDVYPTRGLVESWLRARIEVDKVKYEPVAGSMTTAGNKVTWQFKPTTGANQIAEATVENGKITSLTIRNVPVATAVPAAAAPAAQATAAPAAGAAATAAPTPSALPTTGGSDGLSLLWLVAVGVMLVGVGLAARRLNA